MIGFHLQNSTPNWPDAVRRLPPGTPVKFVFGVERCREAKAVNPAIKTWYRWVGGQPMPSRAALAADENPHAIWHNATVPESAFGPMPTRFSIPPSLFASRSVVGPDYEAHARAWLNQFVDGTFRREAKHVDYVGEYNETLANSQSAEEKAAWLALHTAMAKVWFEEYRKEPELAHIRMTLCATAVGNDIPIEFARAAVKYDALLDYHPYIFTEFGQVRPDDWRWYSGRWAAMDDQYRAAGVRPDWIFGEMGPFRDAKSGWRHKDVLNADVGKYIDALKQWLDKATQTTAWREGRVFGGVLFTSGSPGDEWKWFDTRQPELNAIADMIATYQSPNQPEPPPEQPEPPSGNGWQAEAWAESVRRQAISLNPSAALQAAIFRDGFVPVQSEFWYTTAADGVQRAFMAAETVNGLRPRRVYYAVVPKWNDVRWFTEPNGRADAAYEIADIVEELPKHATKRYATRPLSAIKALTIHHTVSPPDRAVAQIAAYHVTGKDWPGIGYHFVISDTGKIYQTNRLETKSYHAGSAEPGDENLWSVGIALQGDFTEAPPPPAQLDAARWLVGWLKGQLPIEVVVGHREMPGAATACPGATYLEWLPGLVGE